MMFYVGLHPYDARHFDRSMVSFNAIRRRRSDFPATEWILDSGAFTEVTKHGGYRTGVGDYVEGIKRWATCGTMVAAVSQDYMCEPFVLAKTGLSIPEHQRLTVDRYVAIRDGVGDAAYVMPVLQGYEPEEYVGCIDRYADLLAPDAWVGIGSVCKRNATPDRIWEVIRAIHRHRPDLRLHGFGVKLTSLLDQRIRTALHSADSMAWSFAARKQGRNANDWREAEAYVQRVAAIRPGYYQQEFAL